MKWLLVRTLAIHIVFLGSIFVIYFRSPILPNLQPQPSLVSPPAKRLVLFVTDGLRAESFFHNNCNDIQNLKNLITTTGMIGISHTHVPTESRPGHIALIAGLYEDPSAVTKGWKENPVDFDSVFNRSKITFAWGSNDVVLVFSKNNEENIKTFTYDHHLDFSGRDTTSELDTWVFSHVTSFLKQNIDRLKEQDGLVLFLHLLGLDTAGHVHKPGSRLFLENLKMTDAGIFDIYKMIEDTFQDHKTAYVLTSDHGMTDSGSHGAGQSYETETPFFVWGAGINNWKLLSNHPKDDKYFEIETLKIPRIDIEQADMAPLMSTLIGAAVPVNNVGKLPKALLNVSEEYLAHATRNNALQVITQYKRLFEEFQEGMFSKYLLSYNKLSDINMATRLVELKHLMEAGEYKNSIQQYELLMSDALEGIYYYQTYYERALLASTTISFLGWILYLVKKFFNFVTISRHKQVEIIRITISLSLFALAGIYFQNIPLSIGFYLIFPFISWLQPLLMESKKGLFRISAKDFFVFGVLLTSIQLLVLSFFDRRAIAVVMMIYMLQGIYTMKRALSEKGQAKILSMWAISSVLLCVFPFIPHTNNLRQNNILLFTGIALEFFNAVFMWKSPVKKYFYATFLMALINLALSVYQFDSLLGISNINVVITWITTVISFILPMRTTQSPPVRIQSIVHYFFIPYMNLSTGYETIFFVALMFSINAWKKIQEIKLFSSDFTHAPKNLMALNYLHLSFTMLLFILISFFGTGNMASISSFDPITVRCFVTVFSPFLMTFLIIIKLIIPVILISCMFWEIMRKLNLDAEKFFICILLVCEVMAINFLFLVTNKGSWLDIGSSISRFVIMESLILILAILNGISSLLMSVHASPLPHTRLKPK